MRRFSEWTFSYLQFSFILAESQVNEIDIIRKG